MPVLLMVYFRMKVAVSGKGGSGKTTVSGTLARAFATDGLDVLAIDGDLNPNLGHSLGIPHDQEVPPVPADYLQQVVTFAPERETELSLTGNSQKIINTYSVETSDGVNLLRTGVVDQADSGGTCVSKATGREILAEIVEERNEVVVMDMYAGVDHLATGTAKPVDTLLVIVEPYYTSLMTGRDTKELAAELDIPDVRVIANKVRNDTDRDVIDEFCVNHDLTIDAVIPFDDAIRQAAQDGTAPIDYDSDTPAVSAIRELADDLKKTHIQRRAQTDPTN